jgi:hypothetical protein
MLKNGSKAGGASPAPAAAAHSNPAATHRSHRLDLGRRPLVPPGVPAFLFFTAIGIGAL